MPTEEALPTEPFITWSGQADPTAAVLAIGVIMAIAVLNLILRQLTLIRKLHGDDHVLSRRLEAEKRCGDFSAHVFRPDILTAHLDFLDRNNAISLNEIRDAKEHDPGVVDAVHSLLDYYDGLARGIDQGVFSERVIKAAHRPGMTRSLRILRPYIEHRRAEFATEIEIWLTLEQLVYKWDHDAAA